MAFKGESFLVIVVFKEVSFFAGVIEVGVKLGAIQYTLNLHENHHENLHETLI